MPLRHVPRLAACPLARPTGGASFLCLPPPQHRPFHCSRARWNADDGGRDHYEILNVRPDASAAEIKKSFYTLSKTHHPDHNPSDPTAPERFMRISAAYTVLSSPDKRAAYDRDVMHVRHHRHHHPAPHRGSYSSTGPAGGRPASGLSRRRSTFTGPPPSFYRSGGWGAHSAKRSAAHEESTGGSGGSRSDMGGMGPSHGHGNQEVPHFDADSHERTHRRMERRRRAVAPGEFQPSFTSEPGVMASFFIVSAALLGALLTPVVIFAQWDQKKVRPQQDRKANTAAPS